MDYNLKLFLNNLSDVELAFFYKYRYNSFLPPSQHKILQEFANRAINLDKINDLIASKVNNNLPNHKGENPCPRCGSNRYFVEKEKITRRFLGFSFENEIDNYICQVCTYNPKKKK